MCLHAIGTARILNEATGQELSLKKEGAPAISSFRICREEAVRNLMVGFGGRMGTPRLKFQN